MPGAQPPLNLDALQGLEFLVSLEFFFFCGHQLVGLIKETQHAVARYRPNLSALQPHAPSLTTTPLQRSYWNNAANKRTSIKRTLVHMLSGQNTTGGEPHMQHTGFGHPSRFGRQCSRLCGRLRGSPGLQGTPWQQRCKCLQHRDSAPPQFEPAGWALPPAGIAYRGQLCSNYELGGTSYSSYVADYGGCMSLSFVCEVR